MPDIQVPNKQILHDALPQQSETDRKLALVNWFARNKKRVFNSSAIAARLPADADLCDPVKLSRALEAISLRSRLVHRDIRQLNPIVLPCVLFRKYGSPLVLTSVSGNVATVVDPVEGSMARDVRFRDLRREVTGDALLVALDEDIASGRLGQSRPNSEKKHWFWGEVRANWRAWMQVTQAAVFLNLLGLALPLFVMNVYDRVIPNLAYVTLLTLAIGVSMALVFDLLLRSLRVLIIERISQRVDMRVSASLFAHAMNVKLLTRPDGAAGITNTIRDFDSVREFFASATVISLIDLVFIGIFLSVLYLIVGSIAIVPMIAVPVVLVLALLAQAPIGRAARQAQSIAMKRHILLVETLSGIETIKSLNAEPAMQREWETTVAASARVNAGTKFWGNLAANGTMMVQQSVSVIVIVWGVFLVAEGRITVGGLIAANILAGRVLAPLGTIAQTIFRAQYAIKALGNLDRFMRLPTDRKKNVTSDLTSEAGKLELRRATLTFSGSKVPALNSVSLTVQPGECLALLGKVGAGKTTLGQLVSGLIEPDEGQVLLDDLAYSQYEPSALRSAVSYLPQKPSLFTGTLRENLMIGAPNASDADMNKALYYAGLDGFVASLPEGLETQLGEKGARLSGGQRQAVALARHFLGRPRLLYLDEPTNAMDHNMEATVAARLQSYASTGVGLMICTHRMSLAGIATRLVVIDAGRIVMDGQRDEVLNALRMGKKVAE